MNLKQDKINECLRLVRYSNRKLNEIRYSDGEGKKHINKKIEVCEGLKSQGFDFLTEAIFTNGKRADILVPERFLVIEIASSEKEISLIKKREEYPKGLRIEIIRV